MPGTGLGSSRPYKAIGAANTTPVLAQTGYVELTGYHLSGLAAAYALKLFDAPNIASVTVGTTVPTLTLPVPAGAGGAIVAMPIPPIRFMTGLVWAATANVADADNTATAGGEAVNLFLG